MAPHTISPSSTSQGLGISYSTLSPAQDGPTGFTGMGVGPKPAHHPPQRQILPSHPQSYHPQSREHFQYPHQPVQYYSQPDFTQYDMGQSSKRNVGAYGVNDPYHLGPDQQPSQQSQQPWIPQSSAQSTHTGGPSPQRIENRQAAFALRPTHKRGNASKGFTSFSAIPPTDFSQPPNHNQQSAYQDDPFALPAPYVPVGLSNCRLPAPPGAQDSLSSIGTSISQRPPQQTTETRREPSRTDSSASVSTGASVSSKMTRRSKSAELLRCFSKNGEGSGKYQELSGYDDLKPLIPVAGPEMEVVADHICEPEESASPEMEVTSNKEITPKAEPRPLPRQPSSSSLKSRSAQQTIDPPVLALPVQDEQGGRPASRLSTTSSSDANAAQSQMHSPTGQSSTTSHIFQPASFPLASIQPQRTLTSSSDPTHQAPNNPRPFTGLMPRSMSQPSYLYSVAETDREALSRSTSQMDHEMKRASQVSTGIHSKNAALFSAESGGMMLAFSPSGDATWREGELICGARTGLIPTPQSVPAPFVPGHSQDDPVPEREGQLEEDRANELRSRPWSDSTMSTHGLVSPSAPLLRGRGRSYSDGATMLERQGTLLHPASSNKRASQELGVMLGGRSRKLNHTQVMSAQDLGGRDPGGPVDKVRLEASKKRKARVEVDVVLERECVVEGGEIRGRMEVRVTGGKRSAGLRVGSGKIRVVGFEEINSTSRHIFYHQPYPLPLFETPSVNGPRSSLFASPPDIEGYRLAAEGSHSIPFQMRLPLDGGAKGAYSSPNGKTPCVRYIVVGSVKIHIPSTGKRSIAHFYRQIIVLPCLNPAKVLVPNPEPIEAKVEKGLGWSLVGEKGKVELRVGLGRRAWVSGQRIWCEVAIHNNSNKKIKSITLALLQTVQTFHPQPTLDTTHKLIKRGSMLNHNDMGTPDVDACQTSTARRKVNEEIMEADFAEKGAGRVTGKGWWTGVEPGEAGHWDMSILVPPGLLSIRRTRLIEVVYTLRVTVNGSIYVDIPITLINFLSIDPPPMPRDGPRLLVTQANVTNVLADNGETYHNHTFGRPGLQHMRSTETMNSNPAKASSTTLHIDALLIAGRARAEAEGRAPQSSEIRPTSMMSEYTTTPLQSSDQRTPDRRGNTTSEYTTTPFYDSSDQATPSRRRPERVRSYLSARSGETESLGGMSSEGHNEDTEVDQTLIAARRAQGRQRSLAAISRAIDRARQEEDQELLKAEEGMGEDLLSPMAEEYKPLQTPAGVSMAIVPGAHTDSLDDNMTPRTVYTDNVGSVRAHTNSLDGTPRTADVSGMESVQGDGNIGTGDSAQEGANVTTNQGELKATTSEERLPEPKILNEDELVAVPSADAVEPAGDVKEAEEEGEDNGDQTILDELVSHHSHQGDYTQGPLSGEYGGYDYDEEIEEGEENEAARALPRQAGNHPQDSMTARRQSLPLQLPVLNIDPRLSIGGYENQTNREAHVKATRSINGSVAVSVMSEMESEVGQVIQAVKRNVSITTRSRLLSLPDKEEEAVSTRATSPPTRKDSNFGPSHTPGNNPYLSVNSVGSGRRPSMSDDPSPPASTKEGSVSSRGSASRRGSHVGGYALGMRRESSNPPISSPLRATISPSLQPISTSEDEGGSNPGRVINKKSSFSFATPGSPIKVKNVPSYGIPDSPRISPRSANPKQLQTASPTVNTKGEAMTRLPSAGVSSLRNEMRPSPPVTPSEDTDRAPPELAPSVASDSGSSDGHLESPPVVEYSIPAAPPVPSKGNTSFDYTGLRHAAVSSAWNPNERITNDPSSYLQTDPHPTERRGSEHRIRSAMSCTSSDDNHSINTHETTSSILPGVKSKIAQLESRDEALRKFSIASIAPPGPAPTYAPPSPIKLQSSIRVPQSPVRVPQSPIRQAQSPVHALASPLKGQESLVKGHSPSGRKSYTSALAPRAPRQPTFELPRQTSIGSPRQASIGSPRQTSLGSPRQLLIGSPRQPSVGSPRDTLEGQHSQPSTGLARGPASDLGGTTYIRPRVYRESKIDLEAPLDPFGLGLKRIPSASSTSTSATALEAALGRKMGPRAYVSNMTISPRSRELPRIPSPIKAADDTDESEGLL